MFVLRTTREITAEALGVTLASVTPASELGTALDQVIEQLASRVAEALVQRQVLDEAAEALAVMPRAKELSGNDVAAVSEAMTNVAVRLLTSSRLDVPYDDLGPDLNFALDLGADSLTRVDLVLLLEESLEVSVPDDSMFLVQSVGDAELFAVLFDRTREEVVIALGEAARDLTFDSPLTTFGEDAPKVALEAAERALGSGLSLPDCPCRTLKDVVRLAFLGEKLRRALAQAAGVAPQVLTASTIPERDLGLDETIAHRVITGLTASMGFGSIGIEKGHAKPFKETLRTLVELSADAVGGTPR